MTEGTQPELYQEKEIEEMFDTKFLPTLLSLFRRIKEQMFANEEIACLCAYLKLEVTDFGKEYTYSQLKNEGKVLLQLIPYKPQPVEQLDVEKNPAQDA